MFHVRETDDLNNIFILSVLESTVGVYRFVCFHLARKEMDEAEKYQQRLQAIAEKRRVQEEEERRRRETEEERLKLQQLKRKSLRDQWLLETPPSSPGGPGADSAQSPEPEEGDRRDEPQAEGPQVDEERQKDLEDECSRTHTDGETQDTAELRVPTPGGDGEQQKYLSQEDLEGHKADPLNWPAALKNGPEERSVLGMVELQVERDLKTGATVILSVAPVAPGQTGAPGETVFDDGRRHVQALGGVTPGPEELGQILDVLKGAGLQALLGDTKVVPNGRGEQEKGEEPEPKEEGQLNKGEGPGQDAKEWDELGGKEAGPDNKGEGMETEQEGLSIHAQNGPETDTDVSCNITHSALQQEANLSAESSKERMESPEMGVRGQEAVSNGETDMNAAGWAGPVTMTFLGFTEAEPEEDAGGEVVHVERVLITEEGDEPLPPGGAKVYCAIPQTDLPTEGEPSVTLTQRETRAIPESAPQGEDTPTAKQVEETVEGGAQKVTLLKQDQGQERGELPEGSVLEATPISSQVCATTLMATPTTSAQEADAQTEIPQVTSLSGADGGATATSESDPELPTHAEGQQIPASPAELQPLVASETESPQPSRAEGGASPKHKTCQCCSVM
ncbi:hypothetical protein GJAV_G00225200 [Gymnothorax javanicus]|nr:hypothetical protein GJAV_G00225200 [Gymnothorax javanicus]